MYVYVYVYVYVCMYIYIYIYIYIHSKQQTHKTKPSKQTRGAALHVGAALLYYIVLYYVILLYSMLHYFIRGAALHLGAARHGCLPGRSGGDGRGPIIILMIIECNITCYTMLYNTIVYAIL